MSDKIDRINANYEAAAKRREDLESHRRQWARRPTAGDPSATGDAMTKPPISAGAQRLLDAYKLEAKAREHEYLESHRLWAAKARMFPSTVSLPEDRSYVSPLGGQAGSERKTQTQASKHWGRVGRGATSPLGGEGAKPKTQGAKPKASWW